MSTVDMPESVAAAFVARVRALPPDALSLAQTLALADVTGLRYDECLALAGEVDGAGAARAIDALVASDGLRFERGCYTLSPAWRQALLESLTPGETHGTCQRV